MHSDLVDKLRCLAVHEESWLVAAADMVEGRHVIRGLLGCPVCHARYPIEHGLADFTAGRRAPLVLAAETVADDETTAIKLAAMLDLTEPSGYVILVGEWARLGAQLREIAPVMVLAVNPPADVAMGNGVSGVTTLDRIPVASGSARAIALGAISGAGQRGIDAVFALGAVQPGGRVVGGAGLEMPSDVQLLARDADHWVGIRSSGARLIRLVRSPG